MRAVLGIYATEDLSKRQKAEFAQLVVALDLDCQADAYRRAEVRIDRALDTRSSHTRQAKKASFCSSDDQRTNYQSARSITVPSSRLCRAIEPSASVITSNPSSPKVF